MQGEAIVEGIVADGGAALERCALQITAIIKCAVADCGDRYRDGDILQCSCPVKGIVGDDGDGVVQQEICDLVAVFVQNVQGSDLIGRICFYTVKSDVTPCIGVIDIDIV